MNRMFLDDLKQKVKRGQRGRVENGRSVAKMRSRFDVAQYDRASRGDRVRGERSSFLRRHIRSTQLLAPILPFSTRPRCPRFTFCFRSSRNIAFIVPFEADVKGADVALTQCMNCDARKLRALKKACDCRPVSRQTVQCLCQHHIDLPAITSCIRCWMPGRIRMLRDRVVV